MLEKIDENFIKRLRVIARGIAKGNCDPDELVNESVEYLLKNKDKYKNHRKQIIYCIVKTKKHCATGVSSLRIIYHNFGNSAVIDHIDLSVSSLFTFANQFQSFRRLNVRQCFHLWESIGYVTSNKHRSLKEAL